MKIGIPRALLYYYYFPLWNRFFKELGCEVVVSPITNKKIVNQGSKVSVPEICVPIKIFNGHVLELNEMGVDYIFAPRMITIEKGKTFCPKFLGLTDMLRYTFPEFQHKFIVPCIKGKTDWDMSVKLLLEDPFLSQYSALQLKRAWKQGVLEWQKFRAINRLGYTLEESLSLYDKDGMPQAKERNEDVSIAIIGYVYDMYDQFVSMEAVKKLAAMGVNVYTFEMLEQEYIDKYIKPMKKSVFWTFSNKMFGAGMHYYEDPKIDGLIYLTAFGCGPDSLIGKILELDSDNYGKPFLTMRVDEHSGENHLQTRIEAFVDMLKRKKHYSQNNIVELKKNSLTKE
ncbi:MAG: acyl-CoA dehydratase activase-related protein [Bacillota bacterium]|jgi:predicted nucleotide-binding protein (sugar kinase/HSP70/actin superfamily)